MLSHLRRYLVFSSCLLIGASVFAQPAVDDKKYPNEAYFDFRGKPVPDELTLAPIGSEPFVKSEPEGLRVTLPKDRKDLAPVTLGTRTGIQGDFEITVALEILSADRPKDGFGVGASLFINKVNPDVEGATLGRLVRPDGQNVVFWDQGFGKKKEALQFDIDFRPSSDKQLRLRMKRTGAKLSYLLGKGLKGDFFDELPAKQFGGNDIKQVLVRVTTGRQPVHVDVRLVDLRIRSGLAPVTPIPEPTASVESSRGWLVAGLCVAVAILSLMVLVLIVVLMRHTRAKAGDSSPPT